MEGEKTKATSKIGTSGKSALQSQVRHVTHSLAGPCSHSRDLCRYD